MTENSSIAPANPLADYEAHRQEIDAAVQRVLSGGRYILGPEVATFEQEFASFLGVSDAVGVGNGTDAVHVEYDSWDLSAGYHGMYKSSESVALSGRVGWKTVAFELPGARLANNQNQSADFRLVVPKGLRVGQVTMTR